MDVAHDVQHSQKIAQDPSALHDFGGMTRIIPSEVDVSQIYVKMNFSPPPSPPLFHDHKDYCCQCVPSEIIFRMNN